MINIFVTYRCNLSCPYCFAGELKSIYPEDMRMRDFARLLRWMHKAGVPAAGFIGGEPTLHQRLPVMLEASKDAGLSTVLFTNGLFDLKLAERLASCVSNFVVNYNDPALYTARQAAMLHASLEKLTALGARITFSKNFTLEHNSYDYLLDGAAQYGVRAIRYDISRPSLSGDNAHVTLSAHRAMLSHVTGFVRVCVERGIKTGLDCCVRLCDLDPEDRRYLERVSMKFTGICHPSIDVHPDLSASYCLPLHHQRVADVTRFADHSALMQHFATAVYPIRFAGVGEECAHCPDFKRFCQGGCMALKQHAPAATYCAAQRIPEQDHHEHI